MTVLLAPQRNEDAVLFNDTHAARQPRRTKLVAPVRERAVCVSARAIHVVPTQTGLPVKALALVVALFTATEACDLHSRGWCVRHIISYVVCMRRYVNVLPTRQHTRHILRSCHKKIATTLPNIQRRLRSARTTRRLLTTVSRALHLSAAHALRLYPGAPRAFHARLSASRLARLVRVTGGLASRALATTVSGV